MCIKEDMRILAIETSCDDTGVAILETSNGNFNVLANIISSQTEIHKKYGGVFPAMAKREHQNNLVPVFTQALKKANLLISKSKTQNSKLKTNSKFQIQDSVLEREPELQKQLIPFFKKYEKPDVGLISVTNGPGLEPCLWVGVNFAKAISSFWEIPLVPVNHIESHILVNLLERPKIKFPAVALVVSGGHTQIILVNGIGKYKILGETRDDAAGECFDKCAKILGLGYPGGPAIAKLASQWKSQFPIPNSQKKAKFQIKLPRPMMNSGDYDFSFSGLKTAVLYADKKIANKTDEYKKTMAVEVQQAIIDVLIKKTMKAVRDYNAKSLILGGGVSANRELRAQFKSKIQSSNSKIDFLIPPAHLSTDNGLMCAVTGFYNKKNTVDWKKIQADGNLRIAR